MGYRSDVSIAIYGPQDAMVPLLAAERLKANSILSADNDYVKHFVPVIYDKKGAYLGIHVSFESVKWYDAFEDVQAWHTLLAEAADIEGICTEFTRVGENVDDIETAYHGDDCQFYLGVHSIITNSIPETTTYSEDQHDNRDHRPD